MNKNTFLKTMGILTKLFPEKNFATDVVYSFVENISDELFVSAIKNIITTQPKIDKSTNIIALIFEEVAQQTFAPATEAWGQVWNLALNTQMNRLENNLAKEALENMGVDGYHIRQSENPDVLRNNFIKFYNELLIRKKREGFSNMLNVKQLEVKKC